MQDHREPPATADEIAQILGPIDETLIAEILRIGPTAAEVLEAFQVQAGEETHQLTGRAAAVFDLLRLEDQSDEER
jgi:hypothetical protein